MTMHEENEEAKAIKRHELNAQLEVKGGTVPLLKVHSLCGLYC